MVVDLQVVDPMVETGSGYQPDGFRRVVDLTLIGHATQSQVDRVTWSRVRRDWAPEGEIQKRLSSR